MNNPATGYEVSKKGEKVEKLPVSAAKEFAEKWDLDQVLILARNSKKNIHHTVSYGKTKKDCGMAAMDIQKLRAVIKAQPTSLKDAIEAAKKIRPSDIEGLNPDACMGVS